MYCQCMPCAAALLCDCQVEYTKSISHPDWSISHFCLVGGYLYLGSRAYCASFRFQYKPDIVTDID